MNIGAGSVSCIITSYNSDSLLKAAVDSVLKQTHTVDEIIIADDFSSDHSRELIRSLCADHPCIRAILREQNIGVAANRDLAIREAKGEFITTLDGDDLFSENKVEYEYHALKEHKREVAYSDIRVVYSPSSHDKRWSTKEFSGKNRHARLHYLAFRSGPIPRDMLLRKSLYLQAGGMRHPLRIFEDWDYKIRLAAISDRWVHSGTTGTYYHRSGTGLSSSSVLEQTLTQATILRDNQGLLISSLGTKKYYQALLRNYLRLPYRYIKLNFSSGLP